MLYFYQYLFYLIVDWLFLQLRIRLVLSLGHLFILIVIDKGAWLSDEAYHSFRYQYV